MLMMMEILMSLTPVSFSLSSLQELPLHQSLLLFVDRIRMDPSLHVRIIQTVLKEE
tara:strand:- start:290 stop:457 length:168 start_codon:yes stop_codon:yes gene_type:complete